MRGRAERNRVEELEDELILKRILARRLWNALRARTGLELEALFDGDDLSTLDAAFEAMEIVWARERILIRPCRTALDPDGSYNTWPTQIEMYVGAWPDGSSRNLTRAQVLMMAGLDPEGADT